LICLFVAFALLAATGWVLLFPREDLQPLPDGLTGLETPRGQMLLAQAEAIADHSSLALHFQPQILNSYCGVASGAIVLSALGQPTSQPEFFDNNTSNVRTRWRVAVNGMTLQNLKDLLAAHGARAQLFHADTFDQNTFRNTVSENLTRSGDYMIVNYQREALGQGDIGHISPISAYDATSDMVLIMDTAANRFPLTWVPLEALFAGMQTIDTETGDMRGYVEVSGLPAH